MNAFRKIIFWAHLAAGLGAGAIILVMSFTGAILAFETELVAWAERDVRRVELPDPVPPRMSLEELQASFSAAHPGVQPSTITISDDPGAAVTFALGREEAYYLNPYTGAVLEPGSRRLYRFMRTMVAWHRWLGQEGEGRATGKAITGASNAAFVVLAVTGLYLWWPRKWRVKGLRRSLWFTGASGPARDWNWHNVFGFWMLIPIIVMSVSGMVISYRWFGDLVYRVVGEEAPVRAAAPAAGARPAGPAAAAPTNIPDAGAARGTGLAGLPLQSWADAVGAAAPGWKSIALRIPAGGAGSGALEATVAHPGSWPRTATTTIGVDRSSFQETSRTAFGDQTKGRQVRSWLRFLHTGQALGWVGQLVAGLGCVAGCVLVYTGFALGLRRLIRMKRPKSPDQRSSGAFALQADDRSR